MDEEPGGDLTQKVPEGWSEGLGRRCSGWRMNQGCSCGGESLGYILAARSRASMIYLQISTLYRAVGVSRMVARSREQHHLRLFHSGHCGYQWLVLTTPMGWTRRGRTA